MTRTSSLKPGDRIYIMDRYSTRPATVKRMTPKGQVFANYDGEETSVHFNADGREMESAAWSRREIDFAMTFEERTEDLARVGRTREAANALCKVVLRSGYPPNERWGRVGLMEEVERLEGLLSAARKAVEAI